MTDAALPGTQAPPDTWQLAILRARIGWICHFIRIITVLWLGWIVVRIIMTWYDRPTLEQNFARVFDVDLSVLSQGRYTLAFAIPLLAWASAALLGWFLWQLFGGYLKGRIFTVDAALRMRAAAIAGLVATFADVAGRPFQYLILIGGLPAKLPWSVYVQPNDLLHLLLASFIFAIATIFKTAAEIAEDHSQIV